MGRSFNGTTAYLSAATPVITALPFTFSAWVFPTSATLTHGVISVTKAGTAGYLLLYLTSTGKVEMRVRSDASVDAQATTVASYAANRWQHVCGVVTSTTSRSVFLGGANKITSNAAGSTPTGLTLTGIGGRPGTTPATFFAGAIADAGIWNASLTDAEIASLASGTPTNRIRRESLVFHTPLRDRWTYDEARGLILADIGPTSASDDPPLLYRERPPTRLWSFPSDGGGGSALTLSLSDGLALSDLRGGAAGYARAVDPEALALGETLARVAAFARGLAESLAIGETTAHSAAYVRAMGDAAVLAEALTASVGFARAMADGVGLGEDVEMLVLLQRSASDSITLGEVLTTLAGWSRSLVETLALVDVVDRVAAFQRAHADAVALAEAVTRLATFARAFTDGLTLSDAVVASLIGIVLTLDLSAPTLTSSSFSAGGAASSGFSAGGDATSLFSLS